MTPQQRRKRSAAYRETLSVVRPLFPSAFPARGRRPPLKIGILREIAGRLPASGGEAPSLTTLRAFLTIWTGSAAYLVSVARRRPRLDLDGAPAGPVDPDHARQAKERLARRRAQAAAARASSQN
jgi:ProP effector